MLSWPSGCYQPTVVLGTGLTVLVTVAGLVVQGAAHGLDGVLVLPQPDVRIDVGRGVDLAVTQQVLDPDQFHALLQQQRGT